MITAILYRTIQATEIEEKPYLLALCIGFDLCIAGIIANPIM